MQEGADARNRRFTGSRQLGMPQSRDEPSRDRSGRGGSTGGRGQRISLRDAESSRYIHIIEMIWEMLS